jgi:hypothetical protein
MSWGFMAYIIGYIPVSGDDDIWDTEECLRRDIPEGLDCVVL